MKDSYPSAIKHNYHWKAILLLCQIGSIAFLTISLFFGQWWVKGQMSYASHTSQFLRKFQEKYDKADEADRAIMVPKVVQFVTEDLDSISRSAQSYQGGVRSTIWGLLGFCALSIVAILLMDRRPASELTPEEPKTSAVPPKR